MVENEAEEAASETVVKFLLVVLHVLLYSHLWQEVEKLEE